MALNVQMIKYHNQLIDEDIVVPRLVNQQSLDFSQLCEYLADGSTLTAGDISAVMKLLEVRLPLLLGLNAKVVCSAEGLTFRPTVSGSLTQSELKRILEERKANETDSEKAEKIDVNRPLTTSDLSISDLTASITIDLPKKWIERFHSRAEFKRVNKTETTESADNTSGTDSSSSTGSDQEGPGGEAIGG